MTPVVQVLSAGVDTLHLSARGELQDGCLLYFKDVRELAATEPEPMIVTLGGGPFSLQVRPHGWRGYPIWASGPDLELFLGATPPFPAVFVQVHALYLHTVGADAALAAVTQWLGRNLFEAPPALVSSRIDVYADTEGWAPTIEDFPRFTCRGSHRRAHIVSEPTTLHTLGVRCSGFTFGRGHVVARAYDKTLECRVHGLTWPEQLWTGRSGDGPVWRVEVQFRRRALAELGIRTPREALDRRQALWVYGMDWLTLRAPTEDPNRSRWPEAPEWTVLRRATVGLDAQPLVREAARAADLQRLVQGFVGYGTSLAAAGAATGVEAAMRRTVPSVEPYLARRGEDLDAIVERKRRGRLEPAVPLAEREPAEERS